MSTTPPSPSYPQRPTTPLRASSRNSLRASAHASSSASTACPLDAFEPAFAELADALSAFESNVAALRVLHASLQRFGESFAAFLYGLEVNAFCVDFPEAPVRESWTLARERAGLGIRAGGGGGGGGSGRGGEMLEQEYAEAVRRAPVAVDETFMTTDVSFVENPSMASKSSSRLAEPTTVPRGGRARGTASRPSRMPAPRGRGRIPVQIRDDPTAGTQSTSGVPRGVGRGRGSRGGRGS